MASAGELLPERCEDVLRARESVLDGARVLHEQHPSAGLEHAARFGERATSGMVQSVNVMTTVSKRP